MPGFSNLFPGFIYKREFLPFQIPDLRRVDRLFLDQLIQKTDFSREDWADF